MKYETAQGLCMRSNLILFVLANQNFIGTRMQPLAQTWHVKMY